MLSHFRRHPAGFPYGIHIRAFVQKQPDCCNMTFGTGFCQSSPAFDCRDMVNISAMRNKNIRNFPIISGRSQNQRGKPAFVLYVRISPFFQQKSDHFPVSQGTGCHQSGSVRVRIHFVDICSLFQILFHLFHAVVPTGLKKALFRVSGLCIRRQCAECRTKNKDCKCCEFHKIVSFSV